MRFWDACALLALTGDEPFTEIMEAILEDDPSMVLWWGTNTECTSGVCRLRREGALTEQDYNTMASDFDQFISVADEIEPSEAVRTTACRLLCTHPLRAADALQLAAAIVWADHQPTQHGFVCLDRRLREAAAIEGFRVLPEVID